MQLSDLNNMDDEFDFNNFFDSIEETQEPQDTLENISKSVETKQKQNQASATLGVGEETINFIDVNEDSAIEDIVRENPADDTKSESIQEEKKPPVTSETKKKKYAKWANPLLNIANSYEFTEFGLQTYKYRVVKNPDNEETRFIDCFCNDVKSKGKKKNITWHTSPTHLTKKYVVVKLEEFVEELKTAVNADLSSDPIINHIPFFITYSQKLNTDSIDVFDDETSKIVFAMISSLSMDTLNQIDSNVDVLVSNGYGGNNTLRLDVVLSANTQVDGTNLDMRDYFTLSKKSYNVRHMSTLSGFKPIIENIQDEIRESTYAFKAYTKDIDKIVKTISEKFKKKSKELYLKLWSNLVDDYKNLYYAFLIASVCLHKNYEIKTYFNIRSYVDSVAKRVELVDV